MCSSPSIPKPAPPEEPLKQVDATMASSSAAAARSQAMRRGLASTWTRFSQSSAAGTGDSAAIAAKAPTLGG